MLCRLAFALGFPPSFIRRRFLAVLGAIALASGPAAAQAPKKDGKAAPFYPARVGDTWVYDDDGEEELTWQVTGVAEKGGETRVTVSQVTGAEKQQVFTVAVSANGLFGVEAAQFKIDGVLKPAPKIDPPVAMLKLPAKAGDSWKYEVASQPGVRGETGTVTVKGEEEVEVPAGKFRAIRVELQLTHVAGDALNPAGLARGRTVAWYAPGVGLVKQVSYGDRTRVLKAFRPAK